MRVPRARGIVVVAKGVAVAGAVILAVASVAVAPAGAVAPRQPASAPTPAAVPNATAGQVIYRQRCANCHGPLGRGRGELADRLPAAPRSFADPAYVRRLVPADAYLAVTEGRPEVAMPPFGDSLEDAQRWDAVYAALSFTYSPERLVRGRSEWQLLCAQCHEPREGPAAEVGWQAARSGSDIFEAVKTGAAEHGELAAVPDSELWRAVDYVRSWGFRPLEFESLATDGQMVGRVVVKGEGEVPVDGQGVRILAFAGGLPGESVTATTGATGVFTATDLLVGPDVIFGLTTQYGGVDYTTVLTDGLAGGPIELPVYETALDVPMWAEYSSVLVSPDPRAGVLRVLELWSIVNDGNRTKVAHGDAATLVFPLPAGARDVAFADPRQQSTAAFEGEVLTTKAPVIPGATEVDLEYAVPYTATESIIARRFTLPTRSWRLAVAGEGVTLEVEGLSQDVTPGPGGDATAARLEARDLEAGREIVVRASNLPEPALGESPGVLATPRLVSWLRPRRVGALAAGLAVFGTLVAMLFPWFGAAGAAERRVRRLAAERRVIVAALVSLEAMHRSGAIDAAAYSRRRARLVERGLRISRHLGGGETDS